MTTPVPPATVRDRVAAFLADADGIPPADVARALDEEGLLAPDQPGEPAPEAPTMTREQAALTLAEMADGHVDNADVYLDSREKAQQACRRAQRRLVTSVQWEPDENARALAGAMLILNDGSRG